MKLTVALMTAIATLLYEIIKAWRPDFPVERNEFYNIVLWVVSGLLGWMVEPNVRRGLVRMGLKGFMPVRKDH